MIINDDDDDNESNNNNKNRNRNQMIWDVIERERIQQQQQK